MEEGRPADGSGHRPAVELEAGLQASGRYYVNVKINSTRVAVAMAAASVVSVAASIATLGAFYVAYPEETEAALRSLFRFFGAEVLGFENGSILVELCLHTKESFRAFMDAFETKAVKQRLQEELSKIGFKGELEVTIVNDKEVYDAFNLIRKEMKKGYSDLEEDSDSSGVETMESEEELSQPPSPGEPLTPPVSDLEELREGSKSADPKSREEMEKRSSDFEADSDSSGVETIESEEELSQPPSPGEPLALSFGDLEELLREGSESVDPQSRKEMEKRSSDFETASDSSGFESMESEEEFSPQHSPRELLTPPLQSSDLEGEELAEEVTPASDKPRRGIMMKAAAASPLVKVGVPTDDELEDLAYAMAIGWEKLGLHLGVSVSKLKEIDQGKEEPSEKVYHMLIHWKRKNGFRATHKVLYDALKHNLVRRRDLAEKFCCKRP